MKLYAPHGCTHVVIDGVNINVTPEGVEVPEPLATALVVGGWLTSPPAPVSAPPEAAPEPVAAPPRAHRAIAEDVEDAVPPVEEAPRGRGRR